MINVILVKHEYRYEIFQIVSLYFDKTEIVFADTASSALEAIDNCNAGTMGNVTDIKGIASTKAATSITTSIKTIAASAAIADAGCDAVEPCTQLRSMTYDLILESEYRQDENVVQCRVLDAEGVQFAVGVAVDVFGDKQFKNAVKATALQCLMKLTGITMPWGILVGIRPTKLIHDARKHGKKDIETVAMLSEEYQISNEKINLVLEVAKHEAAFIKSKPKDVSLYVGIPFCPTRCSYCSFTSNQIRGKEQLAAEYVEALIFEMDKMLSYIKAKGMNVDTLYFGGGTPTALSAAQMDKILLKLSGNLDLKALREFTIEAGRADSIDGEKLKIIKESGCSRISINPQTMNDHTLSRIGRTHTSTDVIHKFQLAREIGFDRINMDMIIGLPGEGVNEINHTVEQLALLSPENITVHTLAVKRASLLKEQEYRYSGSNAVEMFQEAEQHIRRMGLYPYYMYRQKNMVSPLENVGYCKSGQECIYNIQMIAESISIIALGADAVTKVIFPEENRLERAANLKDVRGYITRVDEMIQRKIALFETGRPLTTK